MIKNMNNFYKQINKNIDKYPSLRYGQTAFNTLVDFEPNIAESIRGTDIDPFYCSPDDPKIKLFFEEVERQLKTGD